VTPDRDGRRLRGEDGDVTATVILFPVVLLLVMLVVQFALAYHARSVVVGAAQDATRAAQAETGTEARGHAWAEDLTTVYAGGLLHHVAIDVDRGVTQVTTRVSAEVASVVPGVHLHVTGTAAGPVERFIPQDQR
jgi:Flp pilus assembly protein TadG